jgi:Tol biopolymer transport system component
MTRYNDGPASFSRGGDTIYFSRNLKVDGNIDEESQPRNKLGIFTAVLEDYDWVKILDIRFNNEYYNITTPYISPDGRRLFFASDNPAGNGGTDLYFCNWRGDYWEDPVNMGPEINTPGNESYPFVNSEGGLFFSSDGHPGLGGKDIFYTKQSKDKWLPPVHIDPHQFTV